MFPKAQWPWLCVSTCGTLNGFDGVGERVLPKADHAYPPRPKPEAVRSNSLWADPCAVWPRANPHFLLSSPDGRANVRPPKCDMRTQASELGEKLGDLLPTSLCALALPRVNI